MNKVWQWIKYEVRFWTVIVPLSWLISLISALMSEKNVLDARESAALRLAMFITQSDDFHKINFVWARLSEELGVFPLDFDLFKEAALRSSPKIRRMYLMTGPELRRSTDLWFSQEYNNQKMLGLHGERYLDDTGTLIQTFEGNETSIKIPVAEMHECALKEAIHE